MSRQRYGVQGLGALIGVVGETSTTDGVGVQGTSRESGKGTGVTGSGAMGVTGFSIAHNGTGVAGTATGQGGVGLAGRASGADAVGVWGEANGAAGGLAGYFNGPVLVRGHFVVEGDVAVRLPDGTERPLTAPTGAGEVVGAGSLVQGQAEVALPPAVTAGVQGGNYAVFLAPEGDSRGLYVANKSAAGFSVREQQGGTSTLPFWYRLVVDPAAPAASPAAPATSPAGPTGTRLRAPGARPLPTPPEPPSIRIPEPPPMPAPPR